MSEAKAGEPHDSRPERKAHITPEAGGIFAGGGDSGRLMRSRDWAQTALGPADGWPQSLRTAVSIVLESRFPMYIAWGRDFIQFYNDGYRTILGSTKHPAAMGGPAQVTFAESWHIIAPMFEGVREGKAVGAENLMLPLDRHGYLEECYFTHSYSPIRDESGGVGGVLVTVTETTGRVLGERRLRTLRDIAHRAGTAQREDEVWKEAAGTLAGNAFDVPFALLYRAGDVGEPPTLMETVGWTDGGGRDSRRAAESFNWPFEDVSSTVSARVVSDVRACLGELPGGKWPESPHSAVVLAIRRPGTLPPHGYLVAGVSARRSLDDDYRGFLELLADRLSTAVTNARAFNDERKRAEAPAEVDRVKTAFSSNVSHEPPQRSAATNPSARPPPALAPVPARLLSSFIQGGGEMGALMRSIDWTTTSLGSTEGWPQSLRTSVSTMLRSPYPIILFWGPELRMLYNDPFRPILGSKHPATMGARGYEALAEEWELLGPLMRQVLDTGEPIFIENGNVNFERRQGGLREEAYFTWSYNPTIGEDGEIAGLFAIASETTRQVVGERQLKILRELSIRTALDKTVEQIFRSVEEVLAEAGHDLPFTLLYVVDEENARLVSCTGVTRGAVAAPLQLQVGDLASWPLAEVVSSRQELLLERLDSTFGHLPGGPWSEPSTRALLLPIPMGGDTETLCVLITGLSPLRAVDDEYKSFLQLLGRQLAASISAARAYEQEKQRAEDLAQLDQAKTAFFSNVSHEFRTPLTLILGPIEDALARSKPVLEGVQLDLVRRNALRLFKMVNTLLDFSRMEAGRAQASYVPTELSTFTTSLASAFQSAIEGAGVQFVVDCAPLPEAIYVDPEMWEKVVLNLVSNAVKYTFRGEIRVTLRWQGEGAFLSVSDTGTGIPKEELPRVFERFYRVRATQGRSHEGTGIGLALVQELVKLHGGRVAASSTLGEGTTFTVWMPRGSAHLPSERIERTPRPRTSAGGAAPFIEETRRWFSGSDDSAHADAADHELVLETSPELERSRILLVDDNADLRAYVAELLRRAFPHVTTATNGREALELARAEPPDLILSDVMMPGLDGFGLVRELRADERTRGTPIILLSARAGDESTVEGLRSGADDYLVKPFSARELLARVRTQLEMTRVRRELNERDLTEKRLRETLRARDEWLTVVGHELRTPVSALALSVQSLIRGLTSPDANPKVQATQKSLERLLRQVEGLIEVAELASGQRLELSKEPLDLASLVAEVVLSERDNAARTGSLLEVHAATPVTGWYDRARLGQLLSHLLHNALKFGPGQPIEVSVWKDAEHSYIRIVDHGPGIAPEDHARVLDRFARAAPTESFGGFGLGLWMARQIADAHAGDISLSPTHAGGTTVTVILPADGRPTPS